MNSEIRTWQGSEHGEGSHGDRKRMAYVYWKPRESRPVAQAVETRDKGVDVVQRA